MLKIMGQAAATVTQMQTYIKKVNPKAPDTRFWKMPRKNGKKDIQSTTGTEKQYIRRIRLNRKQILLQS